MGDETCEVCGYQSQLGAVEKHYVIPNDVTQQAGISESHTIRMCCNCRRELDIWYSAKVARMVYDTRLPQFRYKTSVEMVQEYESVFKGFLDYKKRRKK